MYSSDVCMVQFVDVDGLVQRGVLTKINALVRHSKYSVQDCTHVEVHIETASLVFLNQLARRRAPLLCCCRAAREAEPAGFLCGGGGGRTLVLPLGCRGTHITTLTLDLPLMKITKTGGGPHRVAFLWFLARYLGLCRAEELREHCALRPRGERVDRRGRGTHLACCHRRF